MPNDHELTTAIATCSACRIADALKACPRCKFNPGLPFKALKALRVDYPAELREKTFKALMKRLEEQ